MLILVFLSFWFSLIHAAVIAPLVPLSFKPGIVTTPLTYHLTRLDPSEPQTISLPTTTITTRSPDGPLIPSGTTSDTPLGLDFNTIILPRTFVTILTRSPEAHQQLRRIAPMRALPSNVCSMMAADPANVNYTQPYTCTLKTDYAILGLYYDICEIMNNTTTVSSSSYPPTATTSLLALPSDTPPPVPEGQTNTQPSGTSDTSTLHTFCCDPTFSEPETFDTLCVWGNGTNFAAPDAGDPRNITRPAGAPAQCFVSPIIHPKARCVQVPQHFIMM